MDWSGEQMSLIEFFSNKLVIGTSIVTFLGAISPIVLTVADTRYARAENLNQMQSKLEASQRNAVDAIRKEQLEDELFKLRLKPNKTSVDAALIQRAEDRLRETNQRLNK